MAELQKIIKRIMVDTADPRRNCVVKVKQGDRATRYVSVLVCENGEEYEIPQDATTRVNFVKPDGKPCYNTAQREAGTNRVLVELTNQMLAVSGRAECEVEIGSADALQVLTSAVFVVEIEKGLHDEDAILSRVELNALDEIVHRAEVARETSENIAEQVAGKLKEAEEAAEGAAGSEVAAARSATNAADSEENAKTSEGKAKDSETNAGKSEAAAAASEGAAKTSEGNAKDSETNAGKSAAAAAASEGAAKASETNAGKSAAAAAASEGEAKTSEGNAKDSETNAGKSAAAAAASEGAAKASETNAGKSAAAAAASEGAAKASETNAGDSEEAAKEAAQEAKEAAADVENSGMELIDATFAALLDDTNTTKIFKAWWPLSDLRETTKEQRMARWFTMLKNDKTYGVEFESPDVSGNSLGTFAGDRVGVECDLSTDSEQGNDGLDEHRAFWWVRVNAEEIDDQGTLNILATEYEQEYDPTGETAPVMTLQAAPWIRKDKTPDKMTRELRTTAADGYHLWAEARNPDGSERPYVAHYTYGGGYDASSRITSGTGKRPIIRTSYNTGLTAIKKERNFQTGWQDHDQNWLLLMWQLRHGSLEPSGQMEGCLSYNFQYFAAVEEQNTKRVLLTSAQAANFHVGCSVSVGETSGNTSADRGTAHNYNIADCVKVTGKETVNVDGTDYVAVYMDVENTFTTTTTTRISTMPWYSGTTDDVMGRNDGSPRSNTNGQNACRCAGIEFGVGCYRIMYGTVYKYVEAEDGATSELQVWAANAQGKEAGSVTADYIDTGIRMLKETAGWFYIKEMNDTFDTVFFPKEAGGTGSGSTTYLRSAFYHPAYKSGVCVPWSFGVLSHGGSGGVAYVTGHVGPGTAGWHGALGLSRRCWRGEFSAA